MREVVIGSAARSPVAVGKPGGALSEIHPVDVAAPVFQTALNRSGLLPDQVDDVIVGCVSQVDEQSWNIARNIVLAAGWPETVPGTTVDRQCGSGQQAIAFATALVASGQADVVVAGGVESMSRVPMGSSSADGKPYGEAVRARYAEQLDTTRTLPFNQGVAAEKIAAKWGIDRAAMERFALASHQKAASARDAGDFDREIVPFDEYEVDEGIRDTSLEKLAGLKPAFSEDGSITAGLASQISDGAAAVVVMSAEKSSTLRRKPMARVVDHAAVGSDPVMMLDGVIPATEKILGRTGMSPDEIGVFEVNEAFASVPMAWAQATGLAADDERLNPRGGAIALGHPLGATGARLSTSLLHYMQDSGQRYGMQVMCEGGGMANATVYELLN
ncbi:thiolase family protein [Haloglycomyces albus]|uniref:thiolase family protein n=1 Tax=Haloglycomyces albus TaxID=526067 RepID=UPI00046D500C|nr:thiolase family protein [Haloglycomyces albus]